MQSGISCLPMALGFACDHGPEMQEWDRWVEELLKRKKSKSAARSPRFPASSERFQSMLSLARVGSFIAAKNPIFAFPSPTCLAASFFTTDAFMHLRGRQGTPLKSYATIPIRVMGGGSRFSCILPSLLILASSAFSSAPKSMAKPVQYSHVIRAIAAPNVP